MNSKFPNRFIELGAAFQFMLTNRSFQSTTVCQKSHFLEGYYNLVNFTGVVDDQVKPISPRILSGILLGESDISLEGFANSFEGDTIERMRFLISSPRLLNATSEDESMQVIRDYNREARKFNGSNVESTVDTTAEVASAVGELFIDGFSSSIPFGFISKILLKVVEHTNPNFVDRIEAKLKRTTHEGAALAKIRRHGLGL